MHVAYRNVKYFHGALNHELIILLNAGWKFLSHCIFVQVLKDLMGAIDVDGSGSVNLEEWIKGGMNNVPLLVLLGLKVVAHHARHQYATLYNVNACVQITRGPGQSVSYEDLRDPCDT